MRRLVVVFVLALLGTVLALPANAQQVFYPTGVVNTAALNMRTAPDPLAPIITSLPGGTQFSIVRTNLDASWYQAQFADGAGGWVYAQYVIVRGDMSSVPAERITVDRSTFPAALGVIRAIRLNVRSGPGVAFPAFRVAVAGERITLLARSAGWYQVQFEDGAVGWVSSRYVTFYLGDTQDAQEISSAVSAPTVINGLVNQPRLNVRPAPDPNAPPITSVGFMTRVTVLGRNASTTWLLIEANGTRGWVYAPFVQPNAGNFQNAPIAG
jgi:uncharacterized protein YraI